VSFSPDPIVEVASAVNARVSIITKTIYPGPVPPVGYPQDGVRGVARDFRPRPQREGVGDRQDFLAHAEVSTPYPSF